MKFLRKIHALLRRRRFEAEMAEEMRLHLELLAERERAAGRSAAEARFTAQRRFGHLASIQERARDVRRWAWLERWLKDLRFAARNLRRSPGFTVAAVVTLALGIGLNTAAFSLLNSLWLRPLPFDHPDQLVRLRRSTPADPNGGFAPGDYLELRRDEAPFGRFAAFSDQSVSLAEPGQPAERVDLRSVAADYFDLLGIRPELGRGFLPEEEDCGRHRVVVLSHALWEDRFARSPGAIGRTIRIDGEEYEIVGVLPPRASDDRLIRQTALFRPLAFTAAERMSHGNPSVDIIGRRSAGLTEAQGREFVATVGRRLAVAFPRENGGSAWRCEDLLGSTGNASGKAIVAMLLGLTGCVLLIACSNLANLLLARTIGRVRELAVRAALGASRGHLIRPLALEALMLAALGGGAALAVALRATSWLSDQSVASGGAPMHFPLDWRVLGFAVGASVFTALFFGVAPAYYATRFDLNDALKRGAHSTTASRGHSRLRQALAIAQFAIALPLVAGAGFFARGAANFLREHVGWDPRQLAHGAFRLPASHYPGTGEILAFDRQVLAGLRRLPGVQSASLSYGMPDWPLGPRGYLVAGRERPARGTEPAASYNGVMGDYFAATGIRLLRGRVFTAADSATGPRVIIINESMASALFPGEDPLGQHLAPAGTEKPEWAEIVGVVADVGSMAVYRRAIPFQTYHPFAQEPWRDVRIAVRTASVAPASVLPSLRAVVTGLDPDLPVSQLMTVDAMLEHSAFELTMMRNMLGTFALLGLALAALGIYGVLARTVAQRTGEIGIRVALGAEPAGVVRMILGSGLRVALIGAGLGILGACALSRLVAAIMPSLQTNGGLVLGVSAAMLVLVSLAACWLPARRAARVDPLVALRAE